MNITPLNNHLGDLVHVLQVWQNDAEFIYVDPKPCPCCGQKAQETIQFILNLMGNPRLKLSTTKLDDQLLVIPTWRKEAPDIPIHRWRRTSYTKAINLPTHRTNKVVCQFDARSTPHWNKNVSNEIIREIVRLFKGRLVNIGDNIILGTQNMTRSSLSEKWEVLASAKYYIGIDSGMSHLALMTNTPVMIMYSDMLPWLFYPDCGIIFAKDCNFLHSALL